MFYNRGEVLSDQFDHFKFILFCISVADKYAISHVESKARFKDLFDRNAT